MKRLAAGAIALAIILAACGGGSSPASQPTDDDGSAAQTVGPLDDPLLAAAIIAEADDDPSLPGEYVDLPAIYGGPYPDTAQHVQREVDYEAEGVGEPPGGGPHWGLSACGTDPTAAPPFCGPAPWGVYRAPWEPETLLHNLEHAGVVVWYNTADRDAIQTLEEFAVDVLDSDGRLVLVPYPNMADGTVAITTWSRRDIFAAEDLTVERLQDFLDAHYCRFDPEGFCG
jgi:hypothetical protein